jgi:hypothetical protein
MAIHSQRSREGYLLIDNRASGGTVIEVPTLTCSHCHRQVIVNPGRTRDREYCANCDHYICDGCGAAQRAGLACKTMAQVFDEAESAAYRALQAAKTATGQPSIVLTDAPSPSSRS